MIGVIAILTIQEYEFAKGRNFEPLADSRFQIEIGLRIKIQNELFKSNEDFYKFHFEHSPYQVCEECGFPIREYAAVHCSHIMTKGNDPAIKFDFRNANKLCPRDHTKWEDYTKRATMLIYPRNVKTIELLRKEYYQ